jgi:hypothetical protein
VNPAVAIALGAIVLHKSLTWTIGLGAALVRRLRGAASARPTAFRP